MKYDDDNEDVKKKTPYKMKGNISILKNEIRYSIYIRVVRSCVKYKLKAEKVSGLSKGTKQLL